MCTIAALLDVGFWRVGDAESHGQSAVHGDATVTFRHDSVAERCQYGRGAQFASARTLHPEGKIAMTPSLRTGLRSALLAAAVTSLAMPALAETVTLHFVQTNDIDQMAGDDERGGFAKLASAANAERAEEGTTFLVHSGDTLSPSLLSGIDKGAHIIDILNQMDVAVMTPGNHEFDFGAETFRTRIGEATFPVVTSNVREPDGSQPANTMDTLMVDVGDVKVGFYGLTTYETPEVSSPGEITFADEIETARAKQAELKEAGADFVVAVIHSGFAEDMELARQGLADLILTGHDEHLLTYYNGRTAMTESHSQANYVVVTTITLDKTVEDGNVEVSWSPAFEVVDTADVEPDPEIAAVVQSYQEKLDQELGIEIGTTETELDSRRASVRSQETAIGNLIADAMREAVDADVALTNGGGIRGDREYQAGSPLTRGDILAELPFGNKTVKLELTGAKIKEALENGFSQVEEVAGRFPHISGMTVEVDLKKPAAERVVSVMVGGEPLDEAKTYTLATNDFVARGGDGYTAFADATNLIDPVDAQLMASQVIDYVAEMGTVAPEPEGRIKQAM
jgi:5'-nucleotidase/UDP-sugar diphosphatase